jgi:hypothetical protein
MKVAIEHVQHLLAEIAKINRVPITQIVWTHKGKVLDTKKQVEEFQCTGLSNKDFVRYKFYQKKGPVGVVSMRFWRL